MTGGLLFCVHFWENNDTIKNRKIFIRKASVSSSRTGANRDFVRRERAGRRRRRT